MTTQYNAKIKRKRRVAKLRRKKDKVHAAIEKAEKQINSSNIQNQSLSLPSNRAPDLSRSISIILILAYACSLSLPITIPWTILTIGIIVFISPLSCSGLEKRTWTIK